MWIFNLDQIFPPSLSLVSPRSETSKEPDQKMPTIIEIWIRAIALRFFNLRKLNGEEKKKTNNDIPTYANSSALFIDWNKSLSVIFLYYSLLRGSKILPRMADICLSFCFSPCVLLLRSHSIARRNTEWSLACFFLECFSFKLPRCWTSSEWTREGEHNTPVDPTDWRTTSFRSHHQHFKRHWFSLLPGISTGTHQPSFYEHEMRKIDIQENNNNNKIQLDDLNDRIVESDSLTCWWLLSSTSFRYLSRNDFLSPRMMNAVAFSLRWENWRKIWSIPRRLLKSSRWKGIFSSETHAYDILVRDRLESRTIMKTSLFPSSNQSMKKRTIKRKGLWTQSTTSLAEYYNSLRRIEKQHVANDQVQLLC